MRRHIAVVLNLALAVSMAAPAHASGPELAGTLTNGTVVVTPKNLDLLLFGHNTDTTKAMNQVLRGKDHLNAARAELIPSLNVNFLSTISNPPAFLLNFASCLVPFLFPSKWYALNAADKSYAADITGLEITRLNTYSIAYAVLVRIKGDEEVLKSVSQSVGALDEYLSGLDVQAKMGLIPQSDVLRATIERGRISGDMIRLKETIDDEHATLRKMLGFHIDQKFAIDLGDEGASQYEDLKADSPLLLKMVMRAPERTQLDFLLDAAKDGVSGARWAFLSGCSGNSSSVGTNSSGFNVSSGISISIGYGYFPAIDLAKRNVKDVEIQQDALQLELGRTLESTLSAIAGEKARAEQAQASVSAAEALLADQNYLLDLGKVTVRERIEALTALARARTDLISSRVTLNGHRITLKRLALEGKFLKVYIQSNRDLELGTHGSPRRGD
ncbi:MAG: TolC family protein [Deltaproteobacteria bacterium]|nr:TolC family protein [Deltaproteobacteria bacterium]